MPELGASVPVPPGTHVLEAKVQIGVKGCYNELVVTYGGDYILEEQLPLFNNVGPSRVERVMDFLDVAFATIITWPVHDNECISPGGVGSLHPFDVALPELRKPMSWDSST